MSKLYVSKKQMVSAILDFRNGQKETMIPILNNIIEGWMRRYVRNLEDNIYMEIQQDLKQRAWMLLEQKIHRIDLDYNPFSWMTQVVANEFKKIMKENDSWDIKISRLYEHMLKESESAGRYIIKTSNYGKWD
jgi:hypothetical protein